MPGALSVRTNATADAGEDSHTAIRDDLHAEEEMDDDRFTIFDVERAILTGSITERQADHTTSEWKYVQVGESLHGDLVGVVAKLSRRAS